MEFQKAIDSKMAQLEHEIQELKTQRNAHASISKLPDEILLEVFMVLMERFAAEKWYQAAQVCRRWRDVAIGAPMLWTKPDTTKHQLTMLMLERSKEADLTINLDSSTSTQTAEVVLNCIGRIETLTINERDIEDEDGSNGDIQGSPRLLQVILKESRREVPRLKTLEVYYISEHSRWNCERMLRLLHPLNQLQKLLLSTVLFDWNLLPLHNLTHLFLEDVFFPAPISMEQFINTLRQMPRLESLAVPLWSHVLSPHTLPSTTEANLTLPFLRLLCLTDSHPDHILYFLAHTTFPRLRRLELEIVDSGEYTSFVNDYYLTFIQAMASSITNGDFGSFEGISISPWTFKLFMLGRKYDSSRFIHSFEYIPEFPHILLNVPDQWPREDDQIRIYTQLPLDLFELCRSNFSQLLEIAVYDILSEAEFMQLFGRPFCSYLQTITVHNDIADNIPTLTNILAVPPHPARELPAIPFPNIKLISSVWGDFTTPSGSSVLDAFCACLMSRQRCGYPLHCLELRSCSVTSTQLPHLKKAVVSLSYEPFTEEFTGD